jgi:hypothetical protein
MFQPSILSGTEPGYLKLGRAILALCIVLAPLMLSLWFGLCPPFGDPTCPAQGTAAIAAFRTMNPQLKQIFLFANIVIPYVYPLSYVGLGLLAIKRAPWLAALGIACGLAGSIPWGWIAGGQIALIDSMAQIDPNPVFVTIEHELSTNWTILTFAGGWVVGHLLAYVLLGIALARAHAVPQWAAWLIIVSAPLMGPIAYGTGLGVLQVLGYVFVLVGSVPAALAMLKSRDW